MSSDNLEQEQYTYRLTGLTWADCSAKFEQMVKKYPGVKDARLNFAASNDNYDSIWRIFLNEYRII